ncbi:MAG TPA: lysylphosphatidylglycerol synthase transmembrane domain-containing protein [Blastocatellia bacterium]
MKKIASWALKIGISVALYVYILSKVDIRRLWDTTKNAQPAYLLSAILIYLLVQALSAYRWYGLLVPVGMRVSFPRVLALYFLGMYSSLFLPAAIGGDVVKVYYLNKRSRNLSGATATVFLDRDTGLAALLVIAVVAAAVAGTKFDSVALAPVFGLFLIGFVAINLALFWRPTYNLVHHLMKLFKLKRPDEKIERMFVSFAAFRKRPSALTKALLLSLLIQFGGVLVNSLAGISIGMRTHNGLADYMVFIPAISLISMIPISVNGMGWREGAYIILFMSAGATRDQSTVLSLLWLAILVITSLPGGLVYFSEDLAKKLATSSDGYVSPEQLPKEALTPDGLPVVIDE